MEKSEGTRKIPGAHLLSPPVVVVLGLLAAIVVAWFIYKGVFFVSTDDAFIDGDVVLISPKVAAHVLKVPVEDNQAVTEGSGLVELDPGDFEARVQIAAADLEAAPDHPVGRPSDAVANPEHVPPGVCKRAGEAAQNFEPRCDHEHGTAGAVGIGIGCRPRHHL